MRYITILLLLLCTTGISVAQNDSIIKVNRVKYQQLRNKMDEYETVKTTFTIPSGENVQATAYYEGNDLKIIEVIYMSESGHRQVQYYFDKENLFFTLERNQPTEATLALNAKGTKNNKPGTTAPGNARETESRYYFYGDALILWYDTEGNEKDLNVQANLIVGKGFIADAYKIRERLKK